MINFNIINLHIFFVVIYLYEFFILDFKQIKFIQILKKFKHRNTNKNRSFTIFFKADRDGGA